MRSGAVILALALGACTSIPPGSANLPDAAALPARWHYEVRPNADLTRLEATVCFEGPTPHELRAGKDDAATRLRYARWISPGPVRRLPIEDGRVQLGRAPADGCIVYGVDLSEGGSLGAEVRRSDNGMLISPNIWLWRPERRSRSASASLRMVLPAGVRASLPWHLAADGSHYALGAEAFAFDSYAAFGALRRVTGVHQQVPFEVAVMDARLALDDGALARWMRGAIELAGRGPGGFPATRLHVIVVPGGSDSEPVPFGAVTRGGAGSVLLFVSHGASLPALTRDWVLPHEISHLFLPYVAREHAWFSEGLATYYQEILRARAGVLSESEALFNLARSMRSAKPDPSAPALRSASATMHQTYAFRAVYWAGAAYFLMADVELRRQTHGERSLDSILGDLRGAKAGHQKWELDDLLARMDSLAGVPVFRRLAEHCLTRSFPDVEPTLVALGVSPESAPLSIDADAPLRELRSALLQGSSGQAAGGAGAAQP
jgi:hypothetical protein